MNRNVNLLEPRSRRRRRRWRIPGWLFVALLLVVLVSSKAEFVRSDAWKGTAELAVLLLALVPIRVVGRAIEQAFPDSLDPLSRRGRAVLAWLVAPIVVYIACWWIFGILVPDLGTRYFGSPFSETHALAKIEMKRYSRRDCRYQVYGKPLEYTYWKDHHCATQAEFERLPGSGKMRVRGRRSWFGMHIEAVEPTSAAPPLNPP